MRKTLLTLALSSTLCVPALAQAQAASPHSLSANLGFTSNYIFRGTSQTGGKPALQGGFDYSHSSGIYLGTWASNISWLEDFGAYNHSSMEWDVYGGYKGSFGKSDFTYDIGVIGYLYPGNRNAGVASADTAEIYGALGWKFLSLKYSYALSNYFGAKINNQNTDGTWYLDFGVNYPIGESGVSLIGHYGILDVRHDGDTASATKASYDDWKVGLSYAVPSGMLKDVNLGVYYTDTNAKKNAAGSGWWVDGTGYDTAKSAVVVYVSKSF